MTFKDLGLITPILNALTAQGYEKPSPIQEKAIPPALEGRDVLGCAQTGTGKTCAFAAPILQRLNAAEEKGPRFIRALILTPTRELALQIQESFVDYGRNLPLRSAVIFGGVGQAPQVDKLRRGLDVLVATPGRLGDLYNQKFVDLSHVEIFVLDEADRMLDMGFINDVRKILKWLPEKKQTLFFSATMPPEISDLVNSLLHNPVKVAVDPVSSPVEVIKQQLYMVDRGNKSRLLAGLLRTDEVKNALVFTRTKHGANRVVADLEKAGITAAAIHGNKSQTARQQALSDFKAGRIRALVATDIAARGLDIEDLSHVFNYNLPEVPETYVHRIGRTGRAGRDGVAISFCEFAEKSCLRDVERLIGKRIPVVADHDWPMQVFETAAKDARGRTVNPDDAEARDAAKERRRIRDAANRGISEGRGAKETHRMMGRNAQAPKPAPKAVAPKAPAYTADDPAQLAEKKKRGRGHRNSTTLEEALVATQPTARPRPEPSRDFYRPDPLGSDTIMDATARMLAPRRQPTPVPPQPQQPRQTGDPVSRRKYQAPAEQRSSDGVTPPPEQKAREKSRGETKSHGDFKFPGKKATGVPAPDKRNRDRGRGGHRSAPPEIRRGTQKDSTEQPSLMKPYYMGQDD